MGLEVSADCDARAKTLFGGRPVRTLQYIGPEKRGFLPYLIPWGAGHNFEITFEDDEKRTVTEGAYREGCTIQCD